MSDKNDDVKARMLAALEAKKNKKGAPGTQTHSETGSRFVVDSAVAVLRRYSAKQDLLVLALLAK